MNRNHIPHHALDLRHITIAVLLALLAVFAVCALPTAQANAADEPVQIRNAEDLANVRNDLSGSYILMDDIDLAGVPWTPIGKPSNFNDSSGGGTGFKGIFDGNGYTISNVEVKGFSVDNNIVYGGFFGCTNGATIKNLTLESCYVTGTYSKGASDRDLMVGGLVGLAVRTNISNCNVINAMVADDYSSDRTDTKNYAIGGMVGDFYTDGNNSVSIFNCSVADATVNAAAKFPDFPLVSSEPIQAFTGGIVGRVRERGTGTAKVVNCMFDGKVTGAGFVGPFIGGARSSGNETAAADISLLAAVRSAELCCYSGIISGISSLPNATYNCGPGVWDSDFNYVKARYRVDDGNRSDALDFLNSNRDKGTSWIVDSANRVVVQMDTRQVSIDSFVLEGGRAKFTASAVGLGSAKLTWWVNDVEAGTGPEFNTLITSQPQKVEVRAQVEGVVFSDSRNVEAAQIEFVLKKARDNNGDVESLILSLENATGFTERDFTYSWYGVKDNDKTDLGKHGMTLNRAEFAGFDKFKVVATGIANEALVYELTTNTSGRTVYLKSDGSDNNDGYDPTRPVQTMQRAYEQLQDYKDAPREANIIVVMDAYTDTEFGYDKSTFNVPATITSYDAEKHVDYRSAPNNAYLSFYNEKGTGHEGDDGTLINGKRLFADTAFKDITLSGAGGKDDNWRIGYIYCQGNSLTMDTGVRMEGYRRTTVSSAASGYGLLAGTSTNDFNIVGGFANYDEPVGTGWSGGTCEIVVRSGSYSRIIAGGRNFETDKNGSVNRTSHNQFGTKEKPFKVAITVDIDTGQSQMGSGGNNCDIGQLTGGQTDGTIYCESTITLRNGVVPQLFGSSIGYNRNVNPGGTTTYPSNDYVGTVQVNMKGGSVAQLYGGCLGRTSNHGSTVVDARFRSFGFKQDSSPDIAININGGSIGPISGITAPLTGVFAAGAGGITGEGDPETGQVTNKVDVAVNISGGTITGNLYGGGYGQSSAVTDASLACIEAGNLYGNTAMTITGGTINADVYGGGAGTAAYLAKNENMNKLAQIVGDVNLSIANAKINGNVYGGSQGVVQDGHDCTSMAKITGNVSLTLDNAHVFESVYGGSALGTVTGNATTLLSGGSASSVVGSVYGAGKGDLVSHYNLEQQKTVGQVGGDATLTISDYAIDGSVFGGGSKGAVLGAKGVATSLTGTSVTGSVYGGGEGSLVPGNDDVDRQTLIGQVASSASLSIAGSTVGGSVFGGGSMGAVLGSTSVKLDNAEVDGSAFAAGDGLYIDENSNITFQRAIGWVKGDAAITLENGASVAGNLFGGGNLGVVGDGTLGSGSVPYSIADPANVVVRVENATVGGSVFGAGAGRAEASGLMPRLFGALFGTASVTVHEGTIKADVFGGGDQSYTYAPLDSEGHPDRAATVIVNGGDSLYVYYDDGRVADGPGEGIREIDVPVNANEKRVINLGGSVFGGGNIADAHMVSANNYTVYGKTEVFVKGAGVDFTNNERGGVYGDGNLSRAYGERTVTLVGLRTEDNGTSIGKRFFSLQRANRAVVHDSSLILLGAKDLVNESDQTKYSLNRVDNLNVYANSTIQFDTVVNGLGNLYSDVLPERTFTSDWKSNGIEYSITNYGDNVSKDERKSYFDFAQGYQTSWTDHAGDQHTSTNTIIVNNGKWLDVKQPADEKNASYGAVTGLFSLISSTAQDGGAFVFGRYSPEDSKGTFITLNRDDDSGSGGFLELYTKSTTDVDGKPCRIWFVRGATYTFDRDVRAYTTGNTASIRVWLPVEEDADGNADMEVSGEGITITGGLDNMQKNKNDDVKGTYSANLMLGEGKDHISKPLPFYQGKSDWGYTYTHYVGGNDPGLMPATITIDMSNIGENDELKPQKGTVEFTLLANHGEQVYNFKITIILERAYAMASETVHYGREYDSIAVENATPITPTSSYTAQFTTTYSPGAYRSPVKAQLSASTTAAIHGKAQDGVFPAGTKITMVKITNPVSPEYYYYECKTATKDIWLTEFHSMSDSSQHYENPTGNTIIVEDLLFVVDYSGVSGGRQSSPTYLALNHTYGNNADILRYSYTDENDQPAERYNNLWNDYTISDVMDKDYLKPELVNPKNAALAPIEVGHSDNFMYDTYTTKLVLNKNESSVSTLFEENEVMLQLSLEGKDNLIGATYFNNTFPLGTKIVVKRPNETVVDTRYFHEKVFGEPDGFIMANLGKQLEKEYIIELQVARYVDGGRLENLFSWFLTRASGRYKLRADLYVSADGLYRSTGGGYAYFDAEFQAPRTYADPPTYELGSKYKDGFLEYDKKNKLVGGDIELMVNRNDSSDAEMTVLRRPAGSSYEPVNIETIGGSVDPYEPNDNKIAFTVTDYPASGTYEYEIRLGNTVYYQTVTVP